MYFTDSRAFLPRKIVSYRYYENKSKFPLNRTKNEKIFCIWDVNKIGTPDGSMIDKFGYLWNSEFHGGKITRYDKNGNIDMVIDLENSINDDAKKRAYVTGCCFGGNNLDTLYITCGKGYDEGYIYSITFDQTYGVQEDRFHGQCPQV
eukprot:242505_1